MYYYLPHPDDPHKVLSYCSSQYCPEALVTDKDIVQGDDGELYFAGEELPEPSITYTEQRQQAYPQLTEQLDMLYHDIDQDKLGETAKDSSFYLALKQIKETYPKETEKVKEPIGVNHAHD